MTSRPAIAVLRAIRVRHISSVRIGAGGGSQRDAVKGGKDENGTSTIFTQFRSDDGSGGIPAKPRQNILIRTAC
jgi:hypothetical protein